MVFGIDVAVETHGLARRLGQEMGLPSLVVIFTREIVRRRVAETSHG